MSLWKIIIELTLKSGVSHSAAGEVVDDDNVCWHKKITI
jgi:hypothetical protein